MKIMVVSTGGELKRLHHHTTSMYENSKALDQPLQHWDAFLATLICGRLDSSTAAEWQLNMTPRSFQHTMRLNVSWLRGYFLTKLKSTTQIPPAKGEIV